MTKPEPADLVHEHTKHDEKRLAIPGVSPGLSILMIAKEDFLKAYRANVKWDCPCGACRTARDCSACTMTIAMALEDENE